MTNEPKEIFICVNLCHPSVANYAPTWTHDSRSIPQFSSSTSSSSFPSAFTWAGRRKISKISRSAAAQFRGGLCSLRIIAAETSAGTFFGTPGEGFALRNYTYLQLALGTILARILVSYIFIKPYYDYKVYSIYEYLTARFGVPTKNAASAVFMFTRLLASGARLYVAAIALALAYEMIRGVQPGQKETLFIYIGATIAIVILTAIYTTLGGIKAVIWTDFIQASIMIGSALIALGLLYSAIPGGWNEIVQRHGGFAISDFFTTGLDPAKHGWEKIKGMFEIEYTIFAGLIGSTFITMSTHGTDQDMVQRMLTAPDIRRSRRSLILSGLADIPIVLTFLSIGLLLWVYYQAHPDPTLPKTPNETFCHFILYQMPVGLRGLLIAGIFATAMGSLSTAINALATSFTRDWYEPYINPGSTGEQSLRAVRWATVWFSDPDDHCRIDDVLPRDRSSRTCGSSRSCSEFSATPTARCSVFFSAECLPNAAATISATFWR